MDKSAEGGLKSIGNAMTVRKNPQETRQLQKFPFDLTFVYATGPWASCLMVHFFVVLFKNM